MGDSTLESFTVFAAMVSLILTLLLPFMAAAAPRNQERGILGNLLMVPIDLAQCMGKNPISPLEFAECDVKCGKGSERSEENRGLLGDLIMGPVDLAQCMGKCPVSPLEFAECSVKCGKGSERSEENRGLLGDLIMGPVDLAQCMGKCP